MKIRIDVDLTPAELREFLGLPEVKSLQDRLLAEMRERLEKGEGVDPMALMRPFLAPGAGALETMQRAFLEALASNLGPAARSGGAGEPERD